MNDGFAADWIVAEAAPPWDSRRAGPGRPNAAAENHCEAGRRGEDLALRHLSAKGYRLIARNYRFGRGEIDLIMQDPAGVLVFIEVKSSRVRAAGHPLERIDGRKVRQLQRVAQKYCWERSCLDRDMRFDVVGVDLEAGGILHLANAFLPAGEGYYR
jgi:putative endonuclease